jgi:3-methyl-2-oxobutanoate hydroxymethyltransferase
LELRASSALPIFQRRFGTEARGTIRHPSADDVCHPPTMAEALDLWDQFRRLEDAGAFAVECELVTADVLSEINGCTSLVTISLGSGGDADVIFLFASDICGEKAKPPRHARAWGDLAGLHRAVREERVRALSGFRAAVTSSEFPSSKQIAEIPSRELEDFRSQLRAVRK